MKKILEKQEVFNGTLKLLTFLSKWKVSEALIIKITSLLARLNLFLNKPETSNKSCLSIVYYKQGLIIPLQNSF